MSNRLSLEKSPYLLQHADNPVDWHPWGEEALKRARDEDKPILLSVGYATCHWCHVMAHESFEDEDVAAIINRHFIPVKVDREERPDIDQIYMAACQALTGQGGWPLTVFMTPDTKPFFAGTYFPKKSRYGRPGFMDLLTQLSAKWESHRDVIVRAAEQLTQALQDPGEEALSGQAPLMEALKRGAAQLARTFDRSQGGFGNAPKFPTPHHLNFLLRWHHRTGDDDALLMVEKTLMAMRRGGIFDQVGLGFHRYSVDEKWLVPHFEKMLYDQALLALAYIEAYQATGKDAYSRTAREIFTYVLRDMTSPEGGFYAAEDADSEGQEGLFYVWRPEEIHKIIGEESGRLFCKYYGVTADGNFEENTSIPYIHAPLSEVAADTGLTPDALARSLEEVRIRLFEHREKRIHPLKDDKILTAWNGLMIAALAKGGQVLDAPEYTSRAEAAAGFILDSMKTGDGRLMRRYREGETAHDGYLEDYAFLVWGLLELYETVFNPDYLERAVTLTRTMLDLFWDDDRGGLFFTPTGGEALIARKKEVYDGALPSGNSVAALNLMRLGRLTGDTGFEEKADLLVRAFFSQALKYPMAHTHFLMAVDFMLGPVREMLVSGDPADQRTRGMIRLVHRKFMPDKVLLLRPDGDDDAVAKLAGLAGFTDRMTPVDGQPAFYLCENYACRRPMTGTDEVKSALEKPGQPAA